MLGKKKKKEEETRVLIKMAHLVLSRIEALHANTQLFFQITTVIQHRQSEIRIALFFVHLIPRIIYDT